MKRKVVVLFLILAVVVASCASQSASDMAMPEAPVMEESMEDGKTASNTSTASGGDMAAPFEDMPKMIIYNGEISLVVKDTTVAQEDDHRDGPIDGRLHRQCQQLRLQLVV